MPVEFSVTLQDRPGTLVRLGQMLGEAAVNIEAIQGTSREGHAFVRFVPRDPQQAARILDAAGIGYTQREVLIVKVLDKPIGGGRDSKHRCATFQATVIVIWLHPWVKSMLKVPSTSAAFWASTLIRTV